MGRFPSSTDHINPALMDAVDDMPLFLAWLDGLSHAQFGELLREEAKLDKNDELHLAILRATRGAYELATGARR